MSREIRYRRERVWGWGFGSWCSEVRTSKGDPVFLKWEGMKNPLCQGIYPRVTWKWSRGWVQTFMESYGPGLISQPGHARAAGLMPPGSRTKDAHQELKAVSESSCLCAQTWVSWIYWCAWWFCLSLQTGAVCYAFVAMCISKSLGNHTGPTGLAQIACYRKDSKIPVN